MGANLNENDDLKDQVIKMGDKINDGEQPEQIKPLGTVQTEMDKKAIRDKENMALSAEAGYTSFNISALPSEGKFYPVDCKMLFRACNTVEIKTYSAMVDPGQDGGVDLQIKIGYILENCIKLSWGGNVLSAADYLKDADKVCMMFAVRDRTMQAHNKENKLMNTAKCGECPKTWKYELTNDIFSYYKFNGTIFAIFNSKL